ncbi:MAG TPA: DUF58 domain-containing protein [Bacillaceae bacterium]
MKNRFSFSRPAAKAKPAVSFCFLVLLLGLAFSYAMFQGGFVSWFLFFSFLPFGFYSFLLLLFPMDQFTVSRSLDRNEINSGDALQIRVTVTRKFAFPLFFLVVEDLVPNSLNKRGSKQVLFPGFRRTMQYTYRIEKMPRGEHIFEAIRLKTGDALGLTEKERWYDCRQIILVYPEYEEIVYRPLESRFEQGGTASALQFQKDTSLVAGVREYQPGDRFAWIDWKATARTNDMKSKEFEIRQTNDIMIVLDRTPSAHFELMVKFAASAVRAILRHGGQTGFFSSGEERSYYPIRGGEHQQQELFHHLAKVKSDSEVPLEDILEGEAVFHHQPASLIVVTSRLTQPFIQSAGLYLRKKGNLIVYLVKQAGEPSSAEELAIKAAASQRGMVVKTLYEPDFRIAFSEVKRA